MGYDILKPDTENINKYWDIAIGLQKVDDLEPSEYLYELKNIIVKLILKLKYYSCKIK